MAQRIVLVDAFADRPFTGNPAAVCVLPAPRDSRWMQHLAHEMNQPETAFLAPHEDGYSLRWFTPTIEVDLCGHATLASAHLLWEEGYLAPDQTARFHTRSGLLTAERQGDWIEMDFPAEPDEPVATLPEMAAALGITPRYVGRNRFDYLIVADSAAAIRRLEPDYALLRKIDARGIIVTSLSDDPRFDFISRFFGPATGIDEDPVTGSAHCCLGPFWARRLGKPRLVAYQASQRGGTVRVGVEGSRVLLGGQAMTVLRGELSTEATADV